MRLYHNNGDLWRSTPETIIMSQQVRKTCLFVICTALIAVALSVCGCTTEHYKAEADKPQAKSGERGFLLCAGAVG